MKLFVSELGCCSVGLLLLLALAPVATSWSTGVPSKSFFTQQRISAPTTTTLFVAPSRTSKRRFWSKRVEVRKHIQSKPRATVSYDPSAGTVTNIDDVSTKSWGAFKSKVYGTVDTVNSITSKLRRNKEREVRPPTGGYNDVIESRIFTDADVSTTPAQRLMEEYQRQGPGLEVVQPERSSFDAFKESVYSAADGVFSERPAPPPPAPRLQSFKAATQPNIAASMQVREALPLLNSRNPVKRFLAERKIRAWETEQRKREEALERERQLESIKKSIYVVVDTFQAGAALVVQTPANIVETASATRNLALGFARWAATLPGFIEATANSIAAIPAQVGQTVDEVKDSVDTTFKSTQQFVEDVVSIPKKMQLTLEETKKNVDNTVKAVDTTVTNVKVWAGLEKPPPPPPKEITVANIAKELVGGVAQGGAQVAWWLGKGAVTLTFKGAKAAFAAATATREPEVVTTAAGIPPRPPTIPPPPGVTMEALDIDITEALALAQKALKNAESDAKPRGKESTLEEAVRKAKEAAIAATRDAVEVEEQIKKRSNIE
jgi:hypothetical protein